MHRWAAVPRGQQGSGSPRGNRSCPSQPGLPGDALPALKHQAGRDHPNSMVAPAGTVGTLPPGHASAGTMLGCSQLPERDCSFLGQQNDLWRKQIHELLVWETKQSAQQPGYRCPRQPPLALRGRTPPGTAQQQGDTEEAWEHAKPGLSTGRSPQPLFSQPVPPAACPWCCNPCCRAVIPRASAWAAQPPPAESWRVFSRLCSYPCWLLHLLQGWRGCWGLVALELLRANAGPR